MTISLQNATIAVFRQFLTALSGILDKAASFAEEKKIDPAVLCATRLYPNMFSLARQVQLSCDFAKNTTARLAGTDPPKFEDVETNLVELKARIARTLDFLAKQDPKAIDAAKGREIAFSVGPNKMKMPADQYVTHFAMPNFFFHVTTAYAILRACGIDVGKRDFMGAVPGMTNA
jgi:hypothetical protein